MRVEVDRTLCEANGVCVSFAPEVFEVDDDDELHVRSEVPPGEEERVARAVASCPKNALSIKG
jgi:ferredoxin